ncbi:LysR substrate-binding domain-containing protein [Variovorax sp. J22P168]|uniref:LysR substrate-binding domain-containing protein n=1 Tax=Variovorax jilinensis TaxID=3053513 RepID=UPI002575FA98|nr:LysR substrate-binding domain-containing protein [Variovorax sp. J22P168]MDM0015010.1 LysR substrate-binding domain-containing protein [Variovorax sp. J22P168]
MNLIWLDDFLVLAETGNFSRAADERHLTQPAFSRRIRSLEEWLGTDLFDRSVQPARLTEAGEWLRGAAQELLAQVARLPGEARTVAEAHSSTLRLASTHALSFTFLPRWLRGLEARADVGRIQLDSDVLARCESLLQQGKVHLVLSHSHAEARGALDAAGYASTQVGSDELIPVAATDAKGRARHRLTDAGAKPVPLMDYSEASGLGRILRAVRGEALAALPTQVVFTAHLASVLRTMVLDGRGLAWLPRTLIAEDLLSGTLVEAAAPEWRIPLEIRLYRDDITLGRAAESFWREACEGAVR